MNSELTMNIDENIRRMKGRNVFNGQWTIRITKNWMDSGWTEMH